jgi:hypothetical protein
MTLKDKFRARKLSEPRSDLEAAFQRFHRENPHVYELFKRFAFEAIHSGRSALGAKALWERMRWYASFETTDQQFKLCNNHTAYYARMFMRDFPQYDGFFRTREVRNERI